jgi:hypothetical protein
MFFLLRVGIRRLKENIALSSSCQLVPIKHKHLIPLVDRSPNHGQGNAAS